VTVSGRSGATTMQGAVKHPKLARLFAFAALLVFGAMTLAWWGLLAWLIWHAI
jgi:hypothetical protein